MASSNLSKQHDTIVPLHYWSIFRYKLLWAYESVLEPERREWPYIPSPTAAWLLKEGSVTLRFASGVERYEAGNWVFPREAEAVQSFSRGASLLSLRFYAGWSYGGSILCRQKSISFSAEEEPVLTAHGEQLAHFIKQHYPEARKSSVILKGNFEFHLKLQPVLTQWISSYYTTLSQRGVEKLGAKVLDPRVIKVLHLIEDHPLSQPLEGKLLAEKSGCSLSQLNKLFSQQIGSSPSVLWGRRRLIAAKDELLSTSLNIKSIAYSLGFSSPEHFATWFKNKTGMTPRRYRTARSLVA